MYFLKGLPCIFERLKRPKRLVSGRWNPRVSPTNTFDFPTLLCYGLSFVKSKDNEGKAGSYDEQDRKDDENFFKPAIEPSDDPRLRTCIEPHCRHFHF